VGVICERRSGEPPGIHQLQVWLRLGKVSEVLGEAQVADRGKIAIEVCDDECCVGKCQFWVEGTRCALKAIAGMYGE